MLVGRQSTTKADSSRLKGGWKSEIGRPLVQPPSSFYSRGVTSPADYVNPASKTITIPGAAEARSLPFHLPIPSAGAATRSSLLLALRNPRPPPSHLIPPLAPSLLPPSSVLASRPSREIYSNSNSSTTSRPWLKRTKRRRGEEKRSGREEKRREEREKRSKE